MSSRNRILRGALAITLGGVLTAAPAHAQPSPRAEPARAFVRVDLARRSAYVGQSIPCTVRAYFRADTGVSLSGAPALTAPDFTLAQTDPVQAEATIDGTRYRVVTWKDRISPVKSGHYTLGLDVRGTLEWSEAAPRASLSAVPNDPFGDDDLGSMFGGGGVDPLQQMQKRMQQMMEEIGDQGFGATRRQDVVLHANKVSLDVRALPSAGRPEGFTGAVGHFTVDATADPVRVRAGEPMTLAIRVAGEGSFDRVNLAGLPESDDWKSYPPTATDGKDEKTFTQPVVPQRAGLREVPSVSFSYFDPDATKYMVAKTEPLAIVVAPAEGAAATSDGRVPAATKGPKIAPNADDRGGAVASLAPIYTRSWFWGLQVVPVAGLGAALALAAARRRKEADPERLRWKSAGRAARDKRAEMNRSFAAGDAVGFFIAARGAIQQCLGARWRVEPSAISLSEIESRLGPEEVERIRPVFDADAARFSGAAVKEPDLAPWKQRIDFELDHLEHLEGA